MTHNANTIVAVATPPGTGGIAVIRISGPDAIETVQAAWKGKKLTECRPNSAAYGRYHSIQGEMLDDCIATVFKSPASFTGEDTVELSIHGSAWLQREIVTDLIHRGAKPARPGEFTQRAFLNGKIDLAQAEGVADIIASSSKAAHSMAITQMRGRFSAELNNLRNKLIEFASLLELELDFSEEDVTFADRTQLKQLAQGILEKIQSLCNSYSSGAVLKNGIPVVIAGIPNAGKSSLLNNLLHEDKALVSDIPGTTRDSIEDTLEIDGVLFRIIDTAGLRDSSDKVESMGIGKAREQISKARILLWVFDPTVALPSQIEEFRRTLSSVSEATPLLVFGKSDLTPLPDAKVIEIEDRFPRLSVSAKTGEGIPDLRTAIRKTATPGINPGEDVIVTNARHFEALSQGAVSLRRALDGIDTGLSADFIAQDIREALHHLATVTGAITTPTLLHSIFTRFCIGK